MIDDLTIRPARASDAETIAEFNSRMARETEALELDRPTLLAGVKAAIADANKGRYFVAESGDKSGDRSGGKSAGAVVGQLMLFREWSDWRNGEIWWIASVYVPAEFRGRGIFKKLYAFVRDLALQENAIGLRLYVEKENEKAKHTYQQLGMSMTAYDVMEELFGE